LRVSLRSQFKKEFSDTRWAEFDETYENTLKDLGTTVIADEQRQKLQQMEKYLYDQALAVFIYSPFTLFAVNRAVDFVPQRSEWLRLKDTSVTKNHWSRGGKNN
jgi:peptide/nickel transport system substrate-binding protein